MSEEPEGEAIDSASDPESSGDSQTPMYQKMVEEYGDPFDGAAPIPVPTYSDLFESHELLHLTDEDMTVRMPTSTEVDTSFLNVTLADVLREARENRAAEAAVVQETAQAGPNGPRPNRKKRRSKSPAVTS